MRLIINGHDMDLETGSRIKQTKQTNDIASIESKKSNFTPQFDLPKTPNNVAAMKHLSLVGNTSNIPYQKNEAFLYSSTGECFVYKGWAIIKESTNVYKCYIYDGALELFKAIENFVLSDLDLSELTHAKDVQTVINSWTNENYRYILADFNGKATYGVENEKINIDYLVPSVRTKYLWNKIFETFGFTYSGSIFQTQEFDNHWMTYPKGLNTSDDENTILQSDDYGFLKRIDNPPGQGPNFNSSIYFAQANSYDLGSYQLVNFNNGVFMRVPESGSYRIYMSGTLDNFQNLNSPFQIQIVKNAEAYFGSPFSIPSSLVVHTTTGVITGESFDVLINIENLDQYDSIAIVFKKDGNYIFILEEDTSNLTLELVKLNPNNVDFEEAFIDFSITDFMKEVITDFGLSLFKDKYTNHYQFLTMAERLQSAEVVDWSDKYDRKLSENYIFGNYAQQNILRHKYADDQDNYNDGSISVANVNLSDRRVMFQSRIYTPERVPVDYFGHQTNQYKLFDKEIKETSEGQEISYKSLSKRFHFIRCELKVWTGGIIIGSEQLNQEQSINSAFIESYWKLSKKDLVGEYWNTIMSILNRSLIVKIVNALSEIDICQLDFKKLIYYRQEQAYFMLNKVSGYEVGEKTVTELVKIDRSQLLTPEPFIHFGFGITEKNIDVGDVVDVWLSTIYNLDAFEIEVEGAVKINDYHYQVLAANAGDLNVVVTVKNKKTKEVVDTSEAVLTAVTPE